MRSSFVFILLLACAFVTRNANAEVLPECNCSVDKIDVNAPNYKILKEIQENRKKIDELKGELLVTYWMDVTQTDSLKGKFSAAQIEELIRNQVAGDRKVETKESSNQRYLTFTFTAKANEIDYNKFEQLANLLQAVSGDVVSRNKVVVVTAQ